MDGNRFDNLARTLARSGSRRQALKALAGAAGMGLGLFGGASRPSAVAHEVGATPINPGPLHGQANKDAGFRALRHYLQTAGFQPEGAAEAGDVSEDGTWIASVLGRSYASRQSGVVATLAYVVTASGTVSLAVLASGAPYAVLSVGADGTVVETLIPEPVADPVTSGPARDQLAFAMSYSAAPGVSIQPALAQRSAICDNCQGVCEQTIQLITTAICTTELFQRGGLFARIRLIGFITARCTATAAATPVCVALAIALCAVVEIIGQGGPGICVAGCARLGCGESPPPPPPPTQCGLCQVLQNGTCVDRTDCPNGCNPETGACYPAPEPEPECTAASDCAGCQTCNLETGVCEGEEDCVPPTEPCTAASDCAGCQTCNPEGVCVDNNELCMESCEACVDGTCRTLCGQCAECTPEGTCVEITGCVPECGPCEVLQNDTCVERTDCYNGCNPDTGECYFEVVGCPNSADDPNATCGEGCGRAPTSDNDAFTCLCLNSTEEDGGQRVCVDIIATEEAFCDGAVTCSSSAECPEGSVCVGEPSACVTNCGSVCVPLCGDIPTV